MSQSAPNEPAVSPVIGTILLVAIAVILTAIIAAVVMGLSSGLTEKKEVGLTVTPFVATNTHLSGNPEQKGVIVVIHGGSDVSTLKNLTVLADNSITYDWDRPGVTVRAGEKLVLHYPEIGVPYRFRFARDSSSAGYNPGRLDGARVVVTGEFDDGNIQILFDGYVTIPATNDGR